MKLTTNPEAPVIEMNGVTIALGGEIVLQEVDLVVKKGEVIVLVGPSSAGKTVLLKTMAGLYTPSSGRVLCFGHEWKHLSMTDRHALAAKVGMQFQKTALFDDMTAAENISFVFREHHALSEVEMPGKAMECLQATGLAEAANLYPYEMSGGMQLRLGIARAMALKPEILFFDDPTAGLDPVNSDLIVDLIKALKKEINATVILVTHDMRIAYDFAGRIFLVANQKLIETGSADATKASTDLRVQQFIHGWQEGPLTSNDKAAPTRAPV